MKVHSCLFRLLIKYQVNLLKSIAIKQLPFSRKMIRINFFVSTDSDLFYVEETSGEEGLTKNDTPDILKSTELSRALDREIILDSSVTSPEPQIVTNDSGSNDQTNHYGYGKQDPITPPSLNDLNLPANAFTILAAVAVVPPTANQDNETESL